MTNATVILGFVLAGICLGAILGIVAFGTAAWHFRRRDWTEMRTGRQAVSLGVFFGLVSAIYFAASAYQARAFDRAYGDFNTWITELMLSLIALLFFSPMIALAAGLAYGVAMSLWKRRKLSPQPVGDKELP